MVIESNLSDVMYSRDHDGPRHSVTSSLNSQSDAYPTSGYHENYGPRSYGQIQGHRYPSELGWGPDIDSAARRKCKYQEVLRFMWEVGYYCPLTIMYKVFILLT